MPLVGESAPELRGTAAGGAAVDLLLLRPRPVLVEFFRGTW
jgi:hypothetical protein